MERGQLHGKTAGHGWPRVACACSSRRFGWMIGCRANRRNKLESWPNQQMIPHSQWAEVRGARCCWPGCVQVQLPG
jgi:hypothetical protein